MKNSEEFSESIKRSSPPARSIENRENQLIEKAYDLAEERLDNKTASAQEIVHFLKMGTAKAQLEKKKLEAEMQLLVSKKDAIDSAKRSEEKYDEAMRAFQEYHGDNNDEDIY